MSIVEETQEQLDVKVCENFFIIFLHTTMTFSLNILFQTHFHIYRVIFFVPIQHREQNMKVRHVAAVSTQKLILIVEHVTQV